MAWSDRAGWVGRVDWGLPEKQQMKVGDLVQHRDGEVGLLLEINKNDGVYPYRILFSSYDGHWDWYNSAYIVGVVSAAR